MELFLRGAIAMGCAVAALLFFRFWRRSGDRFFVWFGAAFLIESINRAVFAMSGASHEDETAYVLARLLSYALILGAIIGKNLGKR